MIISELNQLRVNQPSNLVFTFSATTAKITADTEADTTRILIQELSNSICCDS